VRTSAFRQIAIKVRSAEGTFFCPNQGFRSSEPDWHSLASPLAIYMTAFRAFREGTVRSSGIGSPQNSVAWRL
jgi:hypothetical protein